jgi:hypothetical protein
LNELLLLQAYGFAASRFGAAFSFSFSAVSRILHSKTASIFVSDFLRDCPKFFAPGFGQIPNPVEKPVNLLEAIGAHPL